MEGNQQLEITAFDVGVKLKDKPSVWVSRQKSFAAHVKNIHMCDFLNIYSLLWCFDDVQTIVKHIFPTSPIL